MSRHAAPRVRRQVPWRGLAALVAGALVVAGGLWLTFDPSAGDGGLRTEVMPTGTPTPSGSPKPSVTASKATPRSTPSASKPKTSAPTKTATPPATAATPPASAAAPTKTATPPATTTRPSAPSPTPPVATPVPTTERARLLMVEARGGAPLAVYSGMGGYAQDWAEEMARADTLVHSPHNPYSAEVIASGASDAQTAVTLWLNSPPHREIILNPAYRMVGIGYADGYWCAVLS